MKRKNAIPILAALALAAAGVALVLCKKKCNGRPEGDPVLVHKVK